MKPATCVGGKYLLAAVLIGLPLIARAQDPVRTYRNFGMLHEGNIANGKAVFDTKSCVLCHTTDGKGGKAGPDLAAVGDAFGRGDIIDAILEPSATIAVGYGAVTIETTTGQSHLGVIKEANDEQIGLMGMDGVLVRIPTREIKQQTPLPTSLMPVLFQAMTVQEFTDLVEYLTSLKQPTNLLTSNQGMPDVIAALDQPVALKPAYEESMRFASTYVKKPGDVRTGLVWYGQIPGTSHYLAGQQTGQLWRIDQAADGSHTKTLFLDLSSEAYSKRGPNGLVGVTFHPDFKHNHKYYLTHQIFEDGKIFTMVVERLVSDDFGTDAATPSRLLLKIATVTENHTGACLEFGPDKMLYFSLGDTGPQRDPNGHAQNTSLLLGKILRIDVDHRDAGLAYAIPSDNPLRDDPKARPEIWAWGLREPWRFSFDSLTGDLWVGDVGQDRVEEVTMVRRGENHGWNIYEGFEPFSNKYRSPTQKYVFPVMAYKRKYGNSVIGGYVYRGDKKSSFYGVYIFGDYTSKLIWGLTQKDRQLVQIRQLAVAPEPIASFATDEAGRIYTVGYDGMVYELDLANAEFPPEIKAPIRSHAATLSPRQ